MKQLISALFAAAVFLSLAACGAGGTDPQATTNVQEYAQGNLDQVQRVAEENNITSMEDYPFDSTRKSTANTDERYPLVSFACSLSPTDMQPYNFQDDGKAYVQNLVYEFLFDRVGAKELAGRLAKNGYAEDETHYIVEIYDNIFDSAGNHITASDVVFSYDLNANSGYAYNFSRYESAEAINEYTVRFTWNSPLTSLGDEVWLLANVAVISEKAYNAESFSKAPIGTGPYVLSEFVTDSYCLFEVNEDYWQKEELRSEYAKQNAESIRIDLVSDTAMRMLLLENNSSVCNPYLSVADTDSLLKGGEYEGVFNMTTYYASRNSALLPNMSDDSIMKDINMRLACWYAINTASVVEFLGSSANNACIVDASASVGDYDPAWNSVESYQTVFDQDKAKEYLELAGYEGETLTILCGTFATNKSTVQIVAEMLRQVGINTEIVIFEHVMEQQYLFDSTAWDLFICAEDDVNYVINTLSIKYSVDSIKSVDGVNISFIYDETLQDMIDACLNTESYSVELTGEILQYILDNAYSYAITTATSYVAWNKVVAKPVCAYGNFTAPLWNCCEYYLD